MGRCGAGLDLSGLAIVKNGEMIRDICRHDPDDVRPGTERGFVACQSCGLSLMAGIDVFACIAARLNTAVLPLQWSLSIGRTSCMRT
jgi:hypothetical protein